MVDLLTIAGFAIKCPLWLVVVVVGYAVASLAVQIRRLFRRR